jgi:AraC-like DNA-binding protein
MAKTGGEWALSPTGCDVSRRSEVACGDGQFRFVSASQDAACTWPELQWTARLSSAWDVLKLMPGSGESHPSVVAKIVCAFADRLLGAPHPYGQTLRRSRGGDFRAMVALVVIHKRHGEDLLDVRRVATETGVSACHLSKLLKFHTRYGFGEHLAFIRVLSAARQLRDPRLRIKEVASAVGYKHVTQLDRQFGKILRMTPTQFRIAVCVHPMHR